MSSAENGPATPTTIDATIAYLGAQGDGGAHLPDGSIVHVPFTLPGEVVRLQNSSGRWVLDKILTASPDRVEPPCPLFGECGGCTLQHMRPAALLEWKVDRVKAALGKAGFTDSPNPQDFQVPPHSRRRADLAIRRQGKAILLGLHARNSSDVVDLTSCLVLHPTIMNALPALRNGLRSLEGLRQSGDIQLNVLDSGLDVLLSTDHSLTAGDRTRLAALAELLSIPRISWKPQSGNSEAENVAQRGSVRHKLGDAEVSPPPGAFLQATAESELWIQQAVVHALPKKLGKRDTIIELYAGCGTLSFPLANHARVQAYEGYASAASALKAGSGGTRVTASCRDLNRQPIMSKDLTAAAVVVLDPPHAGAKLQMMQLITGKPKTVIYVSCNPAALAKDASGLHSAGYTVSSVTVIDQFLWSAEVEAVCGFTHGSSHRSRNGLSRSG
ncbi:class I SAM-dependent RNA methyltransferase [Acetobacter indonesiensis]|uniref:class I SAM-dependent RNA methyltransferase n=1 Tax=Acetobacter indonesiensis TaxID=104101 RepID=UPI0020A41FAC|nr:23S rRNA methyltransferase [Acetobacter indonesiensis]